MKGEKIVCWRCGATVKPDQRPIKRLEQCTACTADLHVCMLCRHYNPRLSGYCAHDHAEPPLDRERANFCQFFTPRPGAYRPPDTDTTASARAGLDTLFGTAASESDARNTQQASDPAREALDRLFNVPGKDDT